MRNAIELLLIVTGIRLWLAIFELAEMAEGMET